MEYDFNQDYYLNDNSQESDGDSITIVGSAFGQGQQPC